MSSVQVNWYPQQAKRISEGNAQKITEALAYAILGEAKTILEDGNHLDTHFLWQSGYTSNPNGASSIAPDGIYQSTKTGDAVVRVAAAPLATNKGAIVGFAASYAAPVEEKYSYLYGGITRAIARADSIISGLKLYE